MAATSTPDLIAAVADRLTPTERRISEVVLEDPTLLAFGTVADLAERVGTSRPSVVRFAAKLGFEGYSDLQAHVQDVLSHQLTRPAERIRGQAVSRDSAALGEAMASVFGLIDEGTIAALAGPIAGAANVWVLSGETSQAGGHAMHSGLSMLRPNVRFVEEHDAGRDLSDAGPGDVAIVFDFFRYRKAIFTAAQALDELGVTIVAVTDGPLSPLAAIADHQANVTVPAIGPFDSSVPAVAVAELLVSRVAERLHDEATARIDRTEALWEATETFL